MSPDEHPGISTFLVGIAVIVLVDVGMATLMEKRFAYSSGGLRLEREMASLNEDVAGLRGRVGSATVQLTVLEGPLATALGDLRKTRLENVVTLKRDQELSGFRDELRNTILTTENESSNYRESYRREHRAGAVGEVTGSLTLRDGRSYLDATITEVMDVGAPGPHGCVVKSRKPGLSWLRREPVWPRSHL